MKYNSLKSNAKVLEYFNATFLINWLEFQSSTKGQLLFFMAGLLFVSALVPSHFPTKKKKVKYHHLRMLD